MAAAVAEFMNGGVDGGGSFRDRFGTGIVFGIGGDDCFVWSLGRTSVSIPA